MRGHDRCAFDGAVSELLGDVALGFGCADHVDRTGLGRFGVSVCWWRGVVGRRGGG